MLRVSPPYVSEIMFNCLLKRNEESERKQHKIYQDISAICFSKNAMTLLKYSFFFSYIYGQIWSKWIQLYK